MPSCICSPKYRAMWWWDGPVFPPHRLLARDCSVTVRWLPGIEGNEAADGFARAAPGQTAACEEIPDELRWGTSSSHMSRVASEARSRTAAEWIAGRIGARRYRPPPGRGLRRQHLRRERKELAGRYYQFLSGHAAIGAYLRDKLHKIDSDKCWWCDTGQRQSRFHLVARCPAWAGQARVIWRRIGRLGEWDRPLSWRRRITGDHSTLCAWITGGHSL